LGGDGRSVDVIAGKKARLSTGTGKGEETLSKKRCFKKSPFRVKRLSSNGQKEESPTKRNGSSRETRTLLRQEGEKKTHRAGQS